MRLFLFGSKFRLRKLGFQLYFFYFEECIVISTNQNKMDLVITYLRKG